MAPTPPLALRQPIYTPNLVSNSNFDEPENDEEANFDGDKLFTNADNTPYTFMFHASLRQYKKETDETKELIEDNGGAVVHEEANADIILADDKNPSYHKVYQRIIRTTTKKHVETLRWVETCIIICKVQFTRDARSRGGRPAGKEPRTFSPSEKEHIVYYLAHRSPYIPSTQKWQFSSPRSERPYHDNVSRAGNRIWRELYASARPWARNHPWQSYREHYVRNQAQYDLWIQRYVNDNSWLLSEVSRRLIEDLLDEPGAFEDELSQEEHGQIIGLVPKRSASTRYYRSAAQSTGGIPGNGSRAVPRRLDLPPSRSRMNISNFSPTPQSSHQRLERSLTLIEDDESWLINSSDEEDRVTARHLPRALRSPSPHVSQVSSLGRNNGVEQEEREEAVVSSHPFDRHQVQIPVEASLQQTMPIQAQNSVLVTPRNQLPHRSPPSTRGSQSTPRAEIRRTLDSKLDGTDLPHGVELSVPSRSTTSVWSIAEESIAEESLVEESLVEESIVEDSLVDPSEGSAENDMHAELERQLSLLYKNERVGVFGNDDAPSLGIENHTSVSKTKNLNSGPHDQGNSHSQSLRGFNIEPLSQSKKITSSRRQEEIAESVFVCHPGEDVDNAIAPQSPKYATPARSAARSSSAHDGSPSDRRTSEPTSLEFPFNPLINLLLTRQATREQDRARSKRTTTPESTINGSTAGSVSVVSPLKRRRTEDEDDGRRVQAVRQANKAQGPPIKPHPHENNVFQSQKAFRAVLEPPLKPFSFKAMRQVTMADETEWSPTPKPGTRGLRSASTAKRL
ncbi:hypothetical protein FS837_006559 [Tulasnella sp. UAMH 9824]|nr:hypothetical protein FS837_006559 [Tulasnella sp. UAMH 9824]